MYSAPVAAPYYERYWSEAGYNPRRSGPSDLLRSLFKRHIGSDDDCLDVGCGDGGTSGLYLSGHARSYLGVDISGAAIAAARERGLQAQTIEDASVLPFKNGSFDAVVCIEVLEHLFAPHLAAAEALRVLRPGGRCIVTVPNVAHWRDRLDALCGVWQPGGDDFARRQPWRSPHIRFFRPTTLRAMLLDVGFDHVDVTGTPSALFARVPGLRHANRWPGRASGWAVRLSPSLFSTGIAAVAVRR